MSAPRAARSKDRNNWRLRTYPVMGGRKAVMLDIDAVIYHLVKFVPFVNRHQPVEW